MRWRSPWSPSWTTRPDIDQYSITTTPMSKAETTLRLIRTQGFERVMIFCNTKHMCQRLCDDFQRAGANAECIHGDIKQSLRERTMQKFHRGERPSSLLPTWLPGASTWMTWIASSTTRFRRRMNITSTALAGPGGQNGRGRHILS